MSDDKKVNDIFAELLLQLMEESKEYQILVENDIGIKEKYFLIKIDDNIKIFEDRRCGNC